MTYIKKKIWPEFFKEVQSGKKRFELRLGDFSVAEGDTLILQEWDPQTKEYTGREIEKKVGYVWKFNSNNLFWPKAEIERHGLQIISLE